MPTSSGPAVVCPAAEKTIRPHAIATLRAHANARPVVEPQSPGFRLLDGHLQPFRSRDLLHTLVINTPTLLSQHRRDSRRCVASVHRSQLDDPLSQRFFIHTHLREITLRRTRLAQHSTRPPLGDIQTVLTFPPQADPPVGLHFGGGSRRNGHEQEAFQTGRDCQQAACSLPLRSAGFQYRMSCPLAYGRYAVAVDTGQDTGERVTCRGTAATAPE